MFYSSTYKYPHGVYGCIKLLTQADITQENVLNFKFRIWDMPLFCGKLCPECNSHLRVWIALKSVVMPKVSVCGVSLSPHYTYWIHSILCALGFKLRYKSMIFE